LARAKLSPRRSAAEWQALFSKHEQSGLSRLAFCRREGISWRTFDTWRSRLRTTRSKAKFVDVTPKPAGWDVEVALPNGVVLRIRG